MISHKYLYGWIFYFSILLITAIFLSSTPMQVWGRDLSHAVKATFYGDPNTFASAAIEVAQNGWVTGASKLTFDQWPPGFVLLEALLLKLFGGGVPMSALLLVLSAGLFAVVMVEMQRILAKSFGRWSWLAPLLMLSFVESRISLLTPVGLIFGEWLAIGSFFLAVLLMMRASFQATIFAGVLFAVSAYTRSQFEFFLDVILLVSAMLIIWSYFNKIRNENAWRAAKFLLMTMIVAQVLMLPWRFYHLQDGKGLSWVSTGDMIAKDGLSSDVALQEKNGSFLLVGGANVACHVASEHCGEEKLSTYLNIFLEQPIPWIEEKVQLLPKYWYSLVDSHTFVLPYPDYALLNVTQSFLLVCLVSSVALLWSVRKSPLAYLWIGVGIGLVTAHIVIIVFAHFEVRYFFFIKIYGVFSLILLLSLRLELYRKYLVNLPR